MSMLLIARGERLAAVDRLAAAAAIANQALRFGRSRPARIICSASFTNTSDLRRRGRRVRAAIARAPQLAEAHDRLRFVLAPRDTRTMRSPEFEQAIDIRPSLFDAHYTSARPYGDEAGDRARAVLGRAVALRPAHAEARYYLDRHRAPQGDLPSAIRDLGSRCDMRRSSRRHTQARRRFAGFRRPRQRHQGIPACTRDRSTLSDAGNSLGLALMQRGDADEAMQTLRAVIERYPITRRRVLNLGRP